VRFVHLRRTKLADRAHRVAKAVERRGIIGTYELHDRMLANRAARLRLARARPPLDDVQQRILQGLAEEGWYSIAVGELFPDPAVRERLERSAEEFITTTEEGLRREEAGEESGLTRTSKDFVVRRHGWGVTLRPDDPWLSLALDPKLLDLANSYLGLWSKLEYLDLWYTKPAPADAERRASQKWHRDYNDRHLLKVFVYLSDVDEEAGPFEYVPGSAPGGQLGALWPWRPLGDTYPPQDELAEQIGQREVKTFTGAKGTMIFCNTSGFHRGGFATAKPRVLATWTYESPASLKSLTERNFTLAETSNGGLGKAARYAVS
jgi:Phytanoyl-CoA dioxygenase (PhyH)